MRSLLYLSLVVAVTACASRSQPPAAPVTLAITNVDVIPMDRDAILRDRTVLISGDRIVAIDSGARRVGASVRTIDGRGHYLLPGLWDMHVHTLGDAQSFFPLFLAHGVTGVRDMGGLVDTLQRVRERMRSGALTGPRLTAAGPLLDGAKHRWSHSVAWHLTNAEGARAAVDSLADLGVDFLKIYNTLPREAYTALAEAARRRGLAFAGHVPFSISARDASTMGQASFEHGGLDITTAPCVTNGEERARNLLGVWTSSGYEAYIAGMSQLRAERDAECTERLYATYKENGTWVTPTIVNTLKDSATVNWDATSLLTAQQREWCQGTVGMFNAAADSVRRRYYREFLDDVGKMHRAGVRMLAGTDVPNPCVVPGASLHDELAWMVEAGLTNYEALRTATVHPALFLGTADSLGTVRRGMIADLVLVSQNPLDDIRALHSAVGVVLGGRYFAREELGGASR